MNLLWLLAHFQEPRLPGIDLFWDKLIGVFFPETWHFELTDIGPLADGRNIAHLLFRRALPLVLWQRFTLGIYYDYSIVLH
jgi:hypothetical protein